MDRIKIKLATIALAAESASLALARGKSDGVASALLFSFDKDKTLSILGSSNTHEFEFKIPQDEYEVEGDIADSSFTLPAKKLTDLLKNAPAGCVVSLRKEDAHKFTLTFSGLRSKFTINSLDAADYPSFTVPTKDSAYFSLDCPSFLRKLATVSPAMANQDVRYYLNGVQFLSMNNELLMTATDGHRLAQNSVSITPKKNADSFSSILSRDTVDSLKTWLKGVSDEVDVVLTQNFFMTRFKSNQFDCIVRSVLVDGKYPDWQRVVPKHHRIELEIDKNVLKSSTNRVLILSNEKIKGVRLEFKGTDLTLSSANPEKERSEEIINIPECEELTLGVNGSYLLAALSSFESDNINLFMTDNSTALVLKDESESKQLIVLMPMKL